MIPVFEPEIGQTEIDYAMAALRAGEVSGTYGQYLVDFEREFAAWCGCRHGITTTSGTTALHLAAAAAGIGAGDEVLVSASTNIATALCVIHNNAIPVPVDSEPLTWNLDLDQMEALITSRTKAIIPVHLFGHPVDMDRLMTIARKHGLAVIEDCAESHGATCRGRMTGSFGDMGCFSFYANKIITCGEGGMVVTNDDALADKLRLLRNLAFAQPRFKHNLAGFNFRMTGYQAAVGLAQFRRVQDTLRRKREIAATYSRFLQALPGLQLPHEAEWAYNVYWMYALLVKPEFGMSRDALAGYLRDRGVDTRTFFCPMNQQPCLIGRPGFRQLPCPVADRLWEQGLYLPSSHNLNEQTIRTVTDLIGAACQQSHP